MRYLSVEHELPVTYFDGLPALPRFFPLLWNMFQNEGWARTTFAVARSISDDVVGGKNRQYLPEPQIITTDTGPTIEIAPTPALTIQCVDAQVQEIRRSLMEKMQSEGLTLLASGVHPRMTWGERDYYKHRTPRKAYDYAIQERGWRHRSIVHIAASQEIVDIQFDDALRVLRLMHRLSGLFLFLFRNDPDYYGIAKGRLSIRPHAWKIHVPKNGMFSVDRCKVWLPEQEICSWDDYLAYLWEKPPMFILGTKSKGLIYVPEHPSFWDFLVNQPQDGWIAKAIDTGEEILIRPDASHVAQTDWTYMGFARLRWKWQEAAPDIKLLIKAKTNGEIESFLKANLEKLMIENRSNAVGPQNEEFASLAFISGLIENLDKAWDFAMEKPYSHWLMVAESAEWQPMKSKVNGSKILTMLSQLLSLAEEGLKLRGHGEEKYLAPLFGRVERGMSVSEEMLALFKKEGMPALIEKLRY